MKWILALALTGLFALAADLQAQSLDDQYVQVFNLIQEADSLASAQPSQALPKYVQAQTALERIQKGSPDWNPRIVTFRLSYLASRIAALSAKAPEAAPAVAGATNQNPSATSAAASPALEARLNSLQNQVHQLQADKVVLETKLKEALAMQPAESDPRELARAEEKTKALQKENDLLKATLESRKNEPAPPVDTKPLEEAQKNAAALRAENQLLKKQLAESQAAAAAAKGSAAAAAQSTQAQAQLAVLQSDKEKLRSEKASLESKLSEATAKAKAAAAAQEQLAALQSDKEKLRAEKAELETRIKELKATKTPKAAPVSGLSAADAQHIKQLEEERDQLRKQLAAANKKAQRKSKGKKGATDTPELEAQLAAARTRLEVLEARAVPYSAEELALMKQPETKLSEAQPKPGKHSVKELPPASAKLVTEAQKYYANKQFDQAEASYLQVVHQDQKNVPALANLALIQIEAQHFDQAEKNVRQALALDPEDAYSVYVLGILKFRQAKYDEALDTLSRAAKLDPQNAEVQNYLGLALSEKGQRAPAEAALRKAIQLQPTYASAHYNLAIVYLNQKPPAVELARWHYQKALANGMPHNAEIEKRFESK